VLAFPSVNVRGGSLMGVPVITSGAVPVNSADSPGPNTFVVLVDPTRLLLADAGMVTADVAASAALQMVDNPSASAAQMVSLWQNGMAAIRVSRYINWMRADDAGVALLDGVQWGM
jgi:hypothetical protein